MRGYIRRRTKDSWQITVELPRAADGKRRQRFVTVNGVKRDAQAKLAQLLHEINVGTYIDPTNLTLAEYLNKWLEHARAGNTVTGKTWDEYRKIIQSHLGPHLGHVPLSSLKPLHIQAYYADRLKRGRIRKSRQEERPGLSPQTVVHHHTLLHKALQDAVRWQLVPTNPADAVDPPKIAKQEMKILDREGIKKLVERSMSSPYYIAVVIAVSTGMRRGEILALRWEDVDLESGQIMVSKSLQQTHGRALAVKGTKTGKTRVIPISGKTVQELKRHRGAQAQNKLLLASDYQDNGLVCCRTDGSFIVPDLLTNSFTRIVDRAGVNRVRFHDLRHTHVALLIAQGEHVKVISERLGHSSISITMDRYGHLFPSLNRSAADKFDEALGW